MQQGGLFSAFANKIPTLTTSRLTLRALQVRDSADMYEYASCEDVTEYLTWEPHTDYAATVQYLAQVMYAYKKGSFYDWAVILKDKNKMIGTCGFTKFDYERQCGEIGYVINPAYWGMGIAPEAVSAVIQFAFEKLMLNEVEARYIAENGRSRHVMEKCGMTFRGIGSEPEIIRGKPRYIGVCSRINDNNEKKSLRSE